MVLCMCVFLYHVHSANSGTANAVLTEDDGPLDLKQQRVVSLQWASGTQPGFFGKASSLTAEPLLKSVVQHFINFFFLKSGKRFGNCLQQAGRTQELLPNRGRIGSVVLYFYINLRIHFMGKHILKHAQFKVIAQEKKMMSIYLAIKKGSCDRQERFRAS